MAPFDGNPQEFEQTEKTVTKTDDEVVRVLRGAAQLIREFGLAKRTQEDHQGRVCFHGAISKAATGSSRACDRPLAAEAQAVAGEYLKRLGAKGIRDTSVAYKYICVDWNNAPERTAEEVISALEGAALQRAQSLMKKG